MKTLCIVPARSGSKQIKNKNIKKLGRNYLFYYSLKFAKKLKFIDKIVFSSDSKKYLKLASRLNDIELSLRPNSISRDNTMMIDVIKYEFEKLKKKGEIYDLILLLQPTCPFRKIKDFVSAYKELKSKRYDSAISITKVKEHPDRMKVFKKGKLQNYNHKLITENFMPRQVLNPVYLRSGSMYFFYSSLLPKNKIIGEKVFSIKVENKYAINIDTIEDFIVAKYYFK